MNHISRIPTSDASFVQDDHETSLTKTTDAVAAVMSQMPLVNGAVCGENPEVRPTKL